MSQRSLPVVPCLMALTLLMGLSRRASADDLGDLQGQWEMKVRQNGMEQRIVKTVAGTTETVEVYAGEMLVHKHMVDFELKTFGPAKVFVWRNRRNLVGPNAGQKLPDGRYLYRLDKTRWIGIHGMLEGDRTDVLREVFERVVPVAS